ncbi:MAG: TonB-dependent receptor [Phenylobacterium sp.]
MSRATLFAACAALPLLAAGPAFADDAAAPKDLSEVVVTAAPYAVSMDSTLTSVDVVKRDELDTAVAAGLGDVLASVPGVRSSFFGPGASRPVIRGLAGPRVMVLTNGIGMIDASGLSPDHQVASDPQEAERIEVLRGPSALAYGGSAIGGVVNIIDERIPSTFEAGLHGRVLGQVSSVDDGREASAAVKVGVGDGWSFTLDGVHRTAEPYDAPVDPISSRLAESEGLPAPSKSKHTVPNTYADLDAYGGGFSYVGDGGWGGLAIKHTDTQYGSAAEEEVHIGLKQTRVDARGGHDLDLGPFDKVKFAAGWADYKHTEFEGPEVGTVFLSDGYEGRVELVQKEHDGWQGAVGVQGLHRNFDAIGEEALIPKTKITEAGVFTLQRLDKDGWGVEGGLRLDSRKLDSLVGERDFTNLSGSVGVFFRPVEGWFMGVSASHTSRAPTEEELFSDGPHPATGQFEIGDASLGKEQSNSIEGTVHYSAGPWVLDTHLFYSKYKTYIDQFRTGEDDEESGLPIYRFVETGAKFYGAEFEGSYRAWQSGERSVRLEAAADYVHGETDQGPAPRIPPWSVTGRGVYESAMFTATLEARHVAKQDRVAALELPTDDYTMINASLVVRPIKARPDLKVFLDARNLNNVEAREHASFLKDVAPLPGRNIRLGVGYRF